MKFFARVFTPTKNRRLNELVGFLLYVSALLLFLALASYSPLDPSLNTSAPAAEPPARNWVGMAGALLADLMLQALGVAVFLVPAMLAMLATRWFRSRPVESPVAKCVGAAALLIFLPALLALLPLGWRWQKAIPLEGLLGRIVGDVLIRYLNVAGAYIVAIAVIAVALYLSTAFSFTAMRLWLETRFAFSFAAWDRFQDWRAARAKARMERALEQRRAQKPLVNAQVVSAKRTTAAPAGIERAATPVAQPSATAAPRYSEPVAVPMEEPELGARADAAKRGKTTLPRIAGGFKLPSSSLLHRPDEH
ncbi:MAG: DNA translocase FtsK 4TM domain-containing protein, partial [Terriglobales bacterium]